VVPTAFYRGTDIKDIAISGYTFNESAPSFDSVQE
jgi:hypothetical protein